MKNHISLKYTNCDNIFYGIKIDQCIYYKTLPRPDCRDTYSLRCCTAEKY